MADQVQHYTDEQLELYLDGVMSEGDADRLEMHLAECEDCMLRSAAMSRALLLIDGWNAEAHRAAHAVARGATEVATFQMRIVGAIERMLAGVKADTELHRRLVAWQSLGGVVDGAVRVVMRRASEASEIVTEGLKEMIRPGRMGEFFPGLPGLATRGTPGSSDSQVNRTTARVASIGPESGRSAHVDVMADARTIVVAERRPPAKSGALVMLLPLSSDAQPVLRVLAEGDERFEAPMDGEYLVVWLRPD